MAITFVHKFGILAIVLILAMNAAIAGEVNLTSRADIVANSDHDPVNDIYTLRANPLGYAFNGSTSMTVPAMNLKIDDNNTYLVVNPLGTTDFGLVMSTGAFTLGEGKLDVTGRAAMATTAFRSNTFTTLTGTSGVVIGRGGSGSNGIEVQSYGAIGGGVFTHAGSGTVTALSSRGSGAGIMADVFRTVGAHGDVKAVGPTGTGQVALFVDDLFHEGSGMIEAIGGGDIFDPANPSLITERGMYGITVTGGLTVNGVLKMEQQGVVSSINVGGIDSTNFTLMATSVTIGAGATLIPVIDLARTQTMFDEAHLSTGNGNVEIAAGAAVKPEIRNLASLAVGEEREYQFISTGNGVINGTLTLDADPSLILDYSLTADKSSGDKQYLLRFGAKTTPGQIINGYCSDNTQRLIAAMGVGLAGRTGSEAAALNALYDPFANMGTVADMAKYATSISLTSTPQQYSRVAAYNLRQTDSVQYGLFNNINNMVKTYGRAVHDAANARGNQPQNWLMWVDPVYNQSWRHGAITCGFSKSDEKYGGASLGAGKVLGAFSLGASAYYLRGKIDSTGHDMDTDAYGAMAAARYDFLSPGGSSPLVPWLQANLGYSYNDYDQSRRDFVGNWQNSSPDAHLLRAGLAFGLDYVFAGSFVVSPRVGAEYTHIDYKRYSEHNHGSLGLNVSPENHNSFRPFVGLDVEGKINDSFSLTGRAVYRYEAADKRMKMDYNYVSVPTVAARFAGEDVMRSTGVVGVGARYQINERAAVGANYDIWLEDHYVGHQFGLNLTVAF